MIEMIERSRLFTGALIMVFVYNLVVIDCEMKGLYHLIFQKGGEWLSSEQ